ncbi:outer membrane beta-barrel protein [uncultured Bacteroides sp.]|uniref:outer membrane beta-barrel protein n=1 Tax=uncultured Bacteroides sp. TaxID=162156 RepID=UPI0025FF27DD|nr:outer membrane beta-barrel protein [uncultured Bacteroides sp.]
MKPKALLTLLLLYVSVGCLAQAGYTHIEVQSGYELFPDMSNKSGFGLNIGGRYAFNDNCFVAGMLHCGVNNGSYNGMYAGEMTKLDHTLREYMLGVGPGMYLYNGGDRWIYVDVLFGYGFGEELKDASTCISRPLNGFATAARCGVEYQLKNGWIVGANIGGYLVGKHIRPAICLKWGVFLNL